jgi:hypothetical protein
MKKILLSFLLLFAVALLFPVNTQAKNGCYSWHGGVSRCDTSTGRQVCNDGTYSPSCTCTYIPPKPTPAPVPAPVQKPVIREDPPMIKDILAKKETYEPNPHGFREILIGILEQRYPVSRPSNF